MKKTGIWLLIFILAFQLAACVELPTDDPSQPSQTETSDPTGDTGEKDPTDDPVVPPPPAHSEYYLEGLAVEDVIRYFNEVVLDAEFSSGGNASLVQKWDAPIHYILYGHYTHEDKAKITEFASWLNTIPGFPGMTETLVPAEANLNIHFCTEQEMVNILGNNFWGMDGGVTFWYLDNKIYQETICYRTDIRQYTRNSVILEEIYNGLGPVQDTDLREDSIIYSGFSEPQELTEVDALILKLLYHPSILPGMNAAECETVIRSLYW